MRSLRRSVPGSVRRRAAAPPRPPAPAVDRRPSAASSASRRAPTAGASPRERRGPPPPRRSGTCRPSPAMLRVARLDREPHVEDVAFADDVVLALHADLAVRLRGLHRPRRDQLVVADDLGADEPALQVGVDHAGCLRRRGAAPNLPRARFVFTGGEERDEVDRPIARRDHLLQAGLLHAELLEQRPGLIGVHLGRLRFDRREHAHRAAPPRSAAPRFPPPGSPRRSRASA